MIGVSLIFLINENVIKIPGDFSSVITQKKNSGVLFLITVINCYCFNLLAFRFL